MFVVMALASITGCAHTSVHWRGALSPARPAGSEIFVLITPAPALPPESAHFAERLLALVREQDPKAEFANRAAAHAAPERRARFLLEAKVVRWRDAQTQYSGEPDSIDIVFRVMALEPSQVLREFEFEASSSRLAVWDASADRLLNGRFRKAVRELLAPTHP